MVAVKDVAREVGLSVTTVSRALTGYDDVAAATRERIRAAAEALDYHPNQMARSLQTRRANAIGLAMPAVHRTYDSFWLDFIGGVAGVCAAKGIDLLLSMSDSSERPARGLAQFARSQRVDGLLLCDIERQDSRIAYLQKHDVPFVAFGRTESDHSYPYCDVDGAAGVMHAVERLLALGHRRIAYLGLDPTYGFSHFRLGGYRTALLKAGVSYDPHLVHEGLTEATADGVVASLLSGPSRPTAIFAAADFLALASLRGARNTGLTVPHNLSIIVFDDNLLVQQSEPPLTAVSQPNRRIGEEVAALLLDRLSHPTRPLVQRLLVPIMFERGSTAPPTRSKSEAVA
jgi:LacI family transcriptional regulator